MRPTIRLGRVRGIAIGVHWSLLVIGFLIASTLAGEPAPLARARRGRLLLGRGRSWAPRCSSARSSPTSSSHALVALKRGQRVEGITLWLLGGVASLRDEAPDARSEFLVAAAGPATSIGLGVALHRARHRPRTRCSPTAACSPRSRSTSGSSTSILAVFNLLPGAPLDGGRILASALWAWRKDRRAAEIAAARVRLRARRPARRLRPPRVRDRQRLRRHLDRAHRLVRHRRVAFRRAGGACRPHPRRSHRRRPDGPDADARAGVDDRGRVPRRDRGRDADERAAHRLRRRAERAAADRRAARGHRRRGRRHSGCANSRSRSRACPRSRPTPARATRSSSACPSPSSHAGQIIGVVGLDEVRLAAGRDATTVPA